MSSASESQLRAEAEAFLVEGHTGGLLNRARALFARFPGPENEQFCAAAYERRFRHLAASGRTRELAETAAQALAEIPGRRKQFTSLWIGLALRSGNADLLATELARPDRSSEDDAVVARIVARHLVGPAVLADAPGIPAEHPLRVQATAIRDAFRAVTSGPVTPATMAPLDAIPRRSPLAPWKVLIHAIAALHAGERSRVNALLAALPADSACGALRNVLRTLAAGGEGAPLGEASGNSPKPGSKAPSGLATSERARKAEGALVAALGGGRVDGDLRDRLRKLDDDLSARRTSLFLIGLDRVLFDLRGRRPALAGKVALEAALLWAREKLGSAPLLEVLSRHVRSPGAGADFRAGL